MILLLVRVIANGPVFSSGHDLKELTSVQGREYHTQVFQACSEASLSVLSPSVSLFGVIGQAVRLCG